MRLPKALEAERLAVRTAGLSKRYGGRPALDDVGLEVPAGSVYLLIGENGAGKSTTLRLLLGLTRATAGRIEVAGLDPMREGARVRAGAGWIPESHDLPYGWLRVGRLLEHHAAYHPSWDAGYAGALAEQLSLDAAARYGKLSKGQRRRVQLVLALAHRPPLLLLDEPSDGLDPAMRERLTSLLAAHAADTGATIVISTHLVHETDRLADHVGVLRGGRLVAQLHRDTLHGRLRRYQAEVPEGWAGAPELTEVALKRNGDARQIRWTVWGEEAEVVARLTRAGATVREVRPLSLEESTLALLTMDTGGAA